MVIVLSTKEKWKNARDEEIRADVKNHPLYALSTKWGGMSSFKLSTDMCAKADLPFSSSPHVKQLDRSAMFYLEFLGEVQ